MSWSMKDKCLWIAASYSCRCIARRCLASFSISLACRSVNSRCWFWCEREELISSLHTSQVAHHAGAYPGFCIMKRLGVFLLPPGWDASPSQGYPQNWIRRVAICTPGRREALWEQCLTQEHNTTQCPRRGLDLGPLDPATVSQLNTLLRTCRPRPQETQQEWFDLAAKYSTDVKIP